MHKKYSRRNVLSELPRFQLEPVEKREVVIHAPPLLTRGEGNGEGRQDQNRRRRCRRCIHLPPRFLHFGNALFHPLSLLQPRFIHSFPPTSGRICYANVLLNTIIETTYRESEHSEWGNERARDLDFSSGESIE